MTVFVICDMIQIYYRFYPVASVEISYIKLGMRRSKNDKVIPPTLHKAATYKAAGSCYQYFLHKRTIYCFL